MNANLKDNGIDVHHDAALTAWNSSAHPSRSVPNSKPAGPLKAYESLRDKYAPLCHKPLVCVGLADMFFSGSIKLGKPLPY